MFSKIKQNLVVCPWLKLYCPEPTCSVRPCIVVPVSESLRGKEKGGYKYNIVYKASKAHVNADMFSRLPLPEAPSEGPEGTVLLLEKLDGSPLTADHISRWTARDPILAHVHEYLLRGWPSKCDNPAMTPYWRREMN